MEEDSYKANEKLLNFTKSNLPIIAIGVLGLIFILIGFVQMLGQSDADIVFEDSLVASESASTNITINVSGEVLSPGVYTLKSDARIQDALIAAGGLSEAADRNYIDRYINLAQKLTDGAKIYIPKISEKRSLEQQQNVPEKISINTASSTELETLPGIGPVTAGKIINGRPYSTINDLIEKKVVGQATFEKIKDLIDVY